MSHNALERAPIPPQQIGNDKDVAPISNARLAWTALAFLAIGIGLRLTVFVQAPSLWLDEAMLAVNIGTRGYAGLFAPLDYVQAAPPGFLWCTKLAVHAAGMSEWSARALPLLAGLGLLPACWYLARHLLPEVGATIMLALAAFSPLLLRYGNEMKPYIVDALVAAVMLSLLLRLLDRSGEPARWWAVIWGGVLAPWVSTVAPFVLGGGLALLFAAHVRRSARTNWRGAVCAGAWALSFAAAYLTFYRPASRNPLLKAYWADSYLDVPPRVALGRLADLAGGLVSATFLEHNLFDLTTQLLRYAFVAAFLGSAVLGAWFLARRRGAAVLGLLVLPAVFGVAAAALRLYPTASVRLTMYAVPPLLVCVSAGIVALASWRSRRVRVPLALAITAIGLVPGVVHALADVRHPYQVEHVRPVIGAALAMDPSLPVYIVAPGSAQWLFYTTDWRAPDAARSAWFASHGPTTATRYDASSKRLEILGESSCPGRSPSGRCHTSPGWTDGQVRTILRVAPGCAFLFASHFASSDLDSLQTGLLRARRRVDQVTAAAGTVLLRTCAASPRHMSARGRGGRDGTAGDVARLAP